MRAALKKAFYAIALVIILPGALVEKLARRLVGRDVFYMAQTEVVSLVPGKVGMYVRNAYYHLMLRSCPWGCCFHIGTIFGERETELGQHLNVGANCIIGLATIGDHTMIAEGAHVLSGKFHHGTADPTIPFQDQPGAFVRVTIGRNCWLGANSVVMADLGENCVVGAGAVVSRAFPANRVLVGNPARAVGNTYELAGYRTDSTRGASSPTAAADLERRRPLEERR